MPYWKLPRVGRAKFVHYCIAVLLVLAAVLLRIFIVKQPPALPFILAVMMSAWYGGIGPGSVGYAPGSCFKLDADPRPFAE